MGYLDSTGLAYFWSKIKSYVDSHGGGGGSVTVDDALSDSSVNPVQNKIITAAINILRSHNILPKVAVDHELPDGADLDDYWMPGVWEIFSGSNAETMTNVPTTHGGAKVITVAVTMEGQYSSQFYITTYGEVWHRYKRNETDAASAWGRIPLYDEVTPVGHDILTIPDVVPDNDDLNNYWDPGVWLIETGAHAATIDNVPQTTTGAKVITIPISTGTYSAQFYLTTNGNLYFRYKRGTSATPSSWVLVTMQGEITAATLHAVQYTSQTLTAAQQNQALSNLGLASNLKAAASVTAANFFSTNPLSSATYDIRKTGNVVSFYAYFASAPSAGTVKAGYRPCGGSGASHYTMMPVYSKSSPYAPIGSCWVSGTGAMTFYGVGSGGYVSGTWVCT